MTVNTPEVATLRAEYEPAAPLVEADLAAEWPDQFAAWLTEALAAGLPEPNAMVLATADERGRPSTRTVLLKSYDRAGFVFFTNYRSRKGAELAANPFASLLFPWLRLHRQVIACGAVERLPAAESTAYFVSRPRGSQLGAWASPQSTALPDRGALTAAYAAAADRFAGAEVPRPEHWGGFRLVPDSVEFWQGQRDRLHDRLRYDRTPDTPDFHLTRLAP
ncbi:pyridoxine/pyridoxamine 5'-phosphate oxidase [Pilimelia anulata]|uniref:Pyridoxine/pyridoxamine 5'-phosphate oxidase n=1 Tax=Pilimelia anulata TaxID=53371 RepID=A0A8J3FDI3_9ACTN|nr:pyridoxine/pyridoxamine 5'-phosphate oxidase [Pilimelia anulata]